MKSIAERIGRLSPEQRALYEKRRRQMRASRPRPQTIPRRQGSGPGPASTDQAALWFFHKMDPTNTAYNISSCTRLLGPMDREIMQRAFHELVTRHEILRTSFREIEGRLHQIVAAESAAHLVFVDVSDAPRDEQEVAAGREISRRIKIPFDLEKGPLVRLVLVRVDREDHVVLGVLHHGLTDWWSFQVFYRELFVLYRQLRDGRRPHLPELPIQFTDYAVWRNQWCESEAFKRQLAYWQKKLEGAPTVLQLLGDRPNPAMPSYNGSREFFTLSEKLTGTLRAINRRANATSLMTLLAASFVFLSRYSGARDLLIGTSVTNREPPETQRLIGYLLNMIVLRGDLRDDPSFVAFLARVRTTVLEAFDNSALPFHSLVEALNPERSLGLHPLYQVEFIYISETGPRLDDRGADERDRSPFKEIDFHVDRQSASADLQISFIEGGETIELWLEYSTDLFDRGTIRTMGDLLIELIDQLATHDQVPVSRVPWFGPERRLTWIDSGLGEPPAPRPAIPIHRRFRAVADRAPDAIATMEQRSWLSYAELNRRSCTLARVLAGRGVVPGSRVALCLPRSMASLLAQLAVIEAGGVYVPIDPHYPLERVRFMLEDAGVKLVLTGPDAPELPLGTDSVLDLSHPLPQGEPVPNPDRNPAARLPSGAPAYIIYTSGTTGRPKGVTVTHRNVTSLVHDPQYVSLDPRDVVLHMANPAFDATTFETWGALLNGARLVVLPTDALDLLAQTLCAHKITTLWLTAQLFHHMVDHHGTELAGVRQVLAGGDVLSPSHVTRFLELCAGNRLINGYGPTESTTFACCCDLSRHGVSGFSAPIGQGIAGRTALILDRYLEPVPQSVVGGLYLGGAGLAMGYHNRPELTAAVFLPHPLAAPDAPGERLYRTGDLARRIRDGLIEFHGRGDTQVKIRGYRIEPREVEAVLGNHPHLAAAAVLARPDRSGHQHLLAYAVAKPGGGDRLRTGWRNWLAKKLPDYMIPVHLTLLDRLPLTPNGKLDQAALPSPESHVAERLHLAPRDQTERRLAIIWAEVLQVARIGIHDNFFHLGGDSILSLLVINKARQAGYNLTPKQLFQNQSVAELAACAAGAGTIAEERGSITGPIPLTPIQHWFFRVERAEPSHFNLELMLVCRHNPIPELLERTLERLCLHHDALRLRFRKKENTWSAEITEPDAGPAFLLDRVVLPQTKAGVNAAIEAAANAAHRSLDIQAGPLFRAVYFQGGTAGSDRLLLVVHHLAMDTVSWSFLVEDLETVYRQLEAGEEPVLPSKTSSWPAWSRHLEAASHSARSAAWHRYQQRIASNLPAEIPADFAGGHNGEADTAFITVELDELETRLLLKDVPPIYMTRVNDPLLTALVLAFGEVSGTWSLLLDLESHGRHDWFEDVDVSRTLGWFTHMVPVLLSLDGPTPPGIALKSVKEQLRAVPNEGLGFGSAPRAGENVAQMPPPLLSFNYLGNTDITLADGHLFQAGPESGAALHAGVDARGHLLEIVGQVSGERLRFHWFYSRQCHREETVTRWAESFKARLQGLIEHCLDSEAGGRTPSDFPNAILDQPTLDSLLTAYPDVEDIYALTPLQEGLLFHALHETDPSLYLEQIHLELKGELDPLLFRDAWQRVVARHGALRTLFRMDLENHVQVVLTRPELRWTEYDWRDLPAAEAEAGFSAFLTEDRAAGLDPFHSVPLRLSLVRLPGRRQHLLFTFHHALLDGWSLGLVLQEVSRHYDARALGAEASPPEPVPYRRYIQWLQSFDQARTGEFWRKTLAGFSEPNQVVAATAENPEGPDHASRERVLSRERSGLLRDLARRLEVTLNTLFQGIWALLIGRYSQREDVVFGVTLSGRPAELEGITSMVGLFINTLPMRLDTTPDQPLSAWLKRVQQNQSELQTVEHSPLTAVRAATGLAHDRDFFESLVIFENFPVAGAEQERWAGQTIEAIRAYEKTTYPLVLQIFPGEVLSFLIVFDPRRFPQWRVSALIDHLLVLFDALLADPDQDIGRLDPLTERERRQLLVAWNDTAQDFDLDRTIHGLFEQRARRTPSGLALYHGGESQTFAALNRDANRLACVLRRLGVKPDTPVAVCMDRVPTMVVGLLAVLKAGGAYLPLDPDYPVQRLAFMLEDARPPVLLTQSRHHTLLPPSEVRVLCVDEEAGSFQSENPRNPDFSLDASLPAYIAYTSGSSGRPKGAIGLHRGAVNRFRWMWRAFPFRPGEVGCHKTALSFLDSLWEIFGQLCNGVPVVLVPQDRLHDPVRFVALLAQRRVTRVTLVPTLLRLLLDTFPDLGRRLPDLRLWVTSGEALPLELARQFHEDLPGRLLLNLYGSSEVSADATCWSSEPGAVRVSIGRPIANTTTWILDPRLRPPPVGIAGDLYLGGVGLGRGYLRRPHLTAQRFLPNPFSAREGARLYRTGDRARFEPNGNLTYLGRTNRQVKVRGFRIEPGEIEAVLARVDGVSEVVVIAREAPGQETRLIAYLTLGKGEATAPHAEAVRAFAAGHLPAYMLPTAFVFLESLPLLPNGKLDSRALPEPGDADGRRQDPSPEPSTATEKRVVELWRELLKNPRIGVLDHFFLMGGHSLTATRLVTRLRRELAIDLPIQTAFDHPIAADFAKAIDMLIWAQNHAASGAGEEEFDEESEI